MKITYYLMMLEQSNDKMEVSQLRTKKIVNSKTFCQPSKKDDYAEHIRDYRLIIPFSKEKMFLKLIWPLPKLNCDVEGT